MYLVIGEFALAFAQAPHPNLRAKAQNPIAGREGRDILTNYGWIADPKFLDHRQHLIVFVYGPVIAAPFLTLAHARLPPNCSTIC